MLLPGWPLAEHSRDGVERWPEVFEAQRDVVLLRPPRDVFSIAVSLVNLKPRSVDQLPRLTFHFAVELRSLRTPCGIQNQKTPAQLQQSPKRIEQAALFASVR